MKYVLNRPRNSLSIDGVQRRPDQSPITQSSKPPAVPKPVTPTAQPAQNHRPFAAPQQLQAAEKHSWYMPNWLQLLVAFPLLLLVAFSIQSPVLGQLLIVGYGVVAFWRRIPSRTTFSMALIATVAMIIILVIRGNLLMAQNFATYTFLLLVVGVFTLSRELKREGGRVYSSRYNRHL